LDKMLHVQQNLRQMLSKVPSKSLTMRASICVFY
jgi:hypothetical protein